MTEARGWRKKALSQIDRIGQIDGQPAHSTVVDASALRFEPLAEGYNRPIRIAPEPTAEGSVDLGGARGEGTTGITELAREVVVDRIVDAHTLGVDKDPVAPLCLDRAIMQRPKHRFGHAGKDRCDVVRPRH